MTTAMSQIFAEGAALQIALSKILEEFPTAQIDDSDPDFIEVKFGDEAVIIPKDNETASLLGERLWHDLHEPRTKSFDARVVVSTLSKLGFEKVSQSGSHAKYRDDAGHTTIVPMHRGDVKPGTLKSIWVLAGLDYLVGAKSEKEIKQRIRAHANDAGNEPS